MKRRIVFTIDGKEVGKPIPIARARMTSASGTSRLNSRVRRVVRVCGVRLSFRVVRRGVGGGRDRARLGLCPR